MNWEPRPVGIREFFKGQGIPPLPLILILDTSTYDREFPREEPPEGITPWVILPRQNVILLACPDCFTFAPMSIETMKRGCHLCHRPPIPVRYLMLQHWFEEVREGPTEEEAIVIRERICRGNYMGWDQAARTLEWAKIRNPTFANARSHRMEIERH